MDDENAVVEPGNSEDDIEEFIRNLLAEDAGNEPVVAEDDGTPETPEETPPAPIAQRWEWDDGISIDREQARTLAQFDAWLAANPELASQIAGVSRGEFELVPKGGRGVHTDVPTPTLPPTPATSNTDDLDLDDPVQRRLWTELQSTREQVNAASEVITRHEAQINQQGQSTTRALVERVSNEYATQHKLTTDELQSLRRQAAYLIPQFSAPTDIATGLPRVVDPVRAIEQSLDAAYWSIPEFRSRALDEMTSTKLDDLRKKAKLNSLGGSSGSVPRRASQPSTDQERRDAMIAEVSAAWNGNGN